MPDADLLLAQSLRATLGQLRRRMRAETPEGDLGWPQFAVLGHLEREGPTTVTRLAALEGMRPQSMGATVAGLEDAGLVSAEADPGDGRQRLRLLTPDGHARLQAMRSRREDWLAQAIRSRLSPAERQQLAAVQPILQRLIVD